MNNIELIQHLEELVSPVHVIKHNGEVLYSSTTRRTNNELYTNAELRQQFMNYLFQLDEPLYLANSRRYAGLLFSNGDYLLVGPVMWINAPKLSCSSYHHLGAAWLTLPRAKKSSYIKPLGDDFAHNKIDPIIKDDDYLSCIEPSSCLLEQSVLAQALKLRIHTNSAEWSSSAVYMLPSSGLQEHEYALARRSVADAKKYGIASKQKTFDLYAIYDTEVLMECAATSAHPSSSHKSASRLSQNFTQESTQGSIQATTHQLSDRTDIVDNAVDILQNDLAVSDGSVNLQNLEAAKQQLLAHHDALHLDVIECNKTHQASTKTVLQSVDKTPIQTDSYTITAHGMSEQAKSSQGRLYGNKTCLEQRSGQAQSKVLLDSIEQADCLVHTKDFAQDKSTSEIRMDVNSLRNTENEIEDNEPVRKLTLAELANAGDNALRGMKNKHDKQRASSALKAHPASQKSLSALASTAGSQDSAYPLQDIVKSNFRVAYDKSASKDYLLELEQLLTKYQLELNIGKVAHALEHKVNLQDIVICKPQIKRILNSGNAMLSFMHSSMHNQFLPGDMLTVVRNEQSLKHSRRTEGSFAHSASTFAHTTSWNSPLQKADEVLESVISDEPLLSKRRELSSVESGRDIEQCCLASKNPALHTALSQGQDVQLAEQSEDFRASSSLKELSQYGLQQNNLPLVTENFKWSDQIKEQESSQRMPTLSLESLANGENSELTGDIWAYCKGRDRKKLKASNKHTGFKAAALKNTLAESAASKNTTFNHTEGEASEQHSSAGTNEIVLQELSSNSAILPSIVTQSLDSKNVTTQSVKSTCEALLHVTLPRTADDTFKNTPHKLSKATSEDDQQTTLNEILADDIVHPRCNNLSHPVIELGCLQNIVSENVVVTIGGLYIFMSRGEFLARELLGKDLWISEQECSTSKNMVEPSSSQQLDMQQVNSCLHNKINVEYAALSKVVHRSHETNAWSLIGVKGQLSKLFGQHESLLAAWGTDISPLTLEQAYQPLECIYTPHTSVSAFDSLAKSALQQNILHPVYVDAHHTMLSKLTDNDLEHESNDITSIYYYAAEYLACSAVMEANPLVRAQLLARVQTRGLSDSFYERAEDVSSESPLKDESLRNERIKAINVLLKTYFEVSRAVSEDNTPIDQVALKEFLSSSVIDSKHLPLQQVLSTETPHNAYSYELKHLQAITDGQPEQALRALRSPMHGEEGRMGFTPLRHAKNSAIINATLDARAAIRGGVRVETAYTMADYMILMSELCQTVEEAVKLREECTYRFAELVQQSKQKKKTKYSVMVSRLLEEMERSIFVKVSREDLVACVSRNEDYVQRVFKEEVGESLMEHMRRIRIERAKDLIANSDIKVSELAELLQFSSTSHFARVFKIFEGVSPAEYKAKHYAKQMHRG